MIALTLFVINMFRDTKSTKAPVGYTTLADAPYVPHSTAIQLPEHY